MPKFIEVTVSRGEGKADKLSFDKSSIMIGRSSGNDICLDVVGVSRYHARLSVDGNRIFVEDLGSTNGTFIGTDRVATAEIGNDDLISIGPVLIAAVLVEVADELSPPPQEFRPQARQSNAIVETPVTAVSPAVSPIPVTQTLVGAQATDSKPPPHAAPTSLAAPPPAAPDAPAQTPAVEVAIPDAHEQDFYWLSLKSFLSPVWPYIMDDSVSEIMINGPSEIYYEKKGHLHRADVQYNNDQLNAAVLNIAQYVGRRVSEDEPYLDARLPDGSRVAVLMPPCSRKGISIAIRKFSKEKLTMDRLLSFGSLSEDMVNYIRAAVLLKKNIIVSGGTSSGKTSLLNVVSSLIPEDEQIITIEDSAELQLVQDHVLPMETKPPDKKGRGQVTIRDLVRASLRMRPDRIVVGEIRSGEALDLLQAMNTGHSGSMATVHASSPRQALTRMETLALFSGIEIPMRALREQVASAIEVIIQASRLPDHSRKVVYISEVNPLSESGEYQVTDIFRFQREKMQDGKATGSHVWTGNQSMMLEEMELAGLTDMVSFFRQGKE